MSGTSTGVDLPVAKPAARKFRVFISYASEDLAIANAIHKSLSVALGDIFAEINIDKRFLQPGTDFKKQIQAKLEITDVFIIVFTGAEKESHSYTGWEVGYFDRIMETSPGRMKVSFYVHKPPAISAEDQGISMGISRDKLQLTPEKFESETSVFADDPMCVMLGKWQDTVDEISKSIGYVVARRPEQDPVACVKALKSEIFRYLKTTVDSVLKPQKQITIRATGEALKRSRGDLPPDALLSPVGAGGSLEIFGFSDTEPITWEKFLEKISDSNYRDSWREAITSVMMSSFPDHINVDNSQIIVSSDGSKAYRLILTTVTKYYNDIYDFNIYFVEALQRPDFGDAATTLLLRGLELVCRFRFMFLEDTSQFSSGVIRVKDSQKLPEIASSLLRELDLLNKDARDASLDDPAKWRVYVSWDDLLQMSKEYRPCEQQIYEIVGRIVQSKRQPELLEPLQRELADVLDDLQKKIRPFNTKLVKQMTRKLEELVPSDDAGLSIAS